MIIAMLGDGAWGTALAMALAHNGHSIRLWCYDQAVADMMNIDRTNRRYLPGVFLPPTIDIYTDIDAAITGADYIFQAVPINFLRKVLRRISFENPLERWVSLSKGIEIDTLLLPSEIIANERLLLEKPAACVGPGFAHELARKAMTSMVVASDDQSYAKEISLLIGNDFILPTVTDDLSGAQYAAAMKNVIALGIGMLDGAGWAHNTQALFVTKAIEEMVRFVTTLGGKAETAYSFAGIGDLFLTGIGHHSKNKRFGVGIGSHMTYQQLSARSRLPEGVYSAASVIELAQKNGIAVPLLRSIYDALYVHDKINDIPRMLRQAIQLL